MLTEIRSTKIVDMVNAMIDIEGVKEIGIGSWMVYAAYKIFVFVHTTSTTTTASSIFDIAIVTTLLIIVALLIVASSILGICLIWRGGQKEMNR